MTDDYDDLDNDSGQVEDDFTGREFEEGISEEQAEERNNHKEDSLFENQLEEGMSEGDARAQSNYVEVEEHDDVEEDHEEGDEKDTIEAQSENEE
ncbi:hypothetical protein BLNAU_3107 [Blattamonas nauphoetae]|uniref:Uncharacterized protein n=1 Tax=Blattamonas nauphoetae TaxID=2049346 RepID=A0ABQ9YE53_9EUKA|nr:hypothetical protein BLNAU_3107 [Blattamonas nauphoetae]